MHGDTRTRTRSRARVKRDDVLAALERRETTRGQVVMGPAFYIWEEDPQQARQWGAELADAWLGSQGPRGS